MNFIYYCFCFRSRKRQSYRLKLGKAASQIERELDLGKFITTQRTQTAAIFSLLSGQQAHFVAKMSQPIVSDGPAESASYSEYAASCSDELGDQEFQKKRAQFADHMTNQIL